MQNFTSMLYKNNATGESSSNSGRPSSGKAGSAPSGGPTARPSSAGATRSRSGNFGYNRGSTGVTNLYTSANPPSSNPTVSSGLYGQSYGQQQQQQQQQQSSSSGSRPSSAGYARPQGSAPQQQQQQQQNALPQSLNGNVPISNVNYGQPMNLAQALNGGMPQSTNTGRPKSAGAVRRAPTDAAQPTASSNLYGTNGVNNMFAPNAFPNQPHFPQGPTVQQTYQTYNPTPILQPAQHQRPLSASATAHTTNNHMYDQWNGTGIKLQYGNNTGGGMPQYTPQQQQQQQMLQQQQQQQQQQALASSRGNSSAASKLRQALDLSHKLDNNGEAGGAIPISELTGLNIDNDAGEGEGLDGDLVLGVEGDDDHKKGMVDDDEMDGKPVDSRSHPEVSMTTPSASVELANGSSIGVDVRNTSLDSFSEDHINIGLSTVPNQFCTKRDALELKKLLLLSAGTRGGIVPSSSAVMDMYMVGKVVGVGSYGKVRAAWHRLTGSKVAIKTYDKAKLKDPAHWKRVHSEIKIMEQISHPRIARMYEAVETPKRMHLIMECLDGGNLCSYVKAKRRLSEDESRRIFFQILQAIEHLHSLGVSHRDVKLENVLFVNDRDIKLIDFGFSTVCQPGKKLKVFCGTPSYMAPEIVRRTEYEGRPVDIWSLGILLYALLCGCFPFRAKAYPDLYRRIARGTFAIPEELSAPVKDLLRQLLTVDADTRITAHNALRHPWLQVQLLNSPNMDKMRQEMTVLISDKPADDLDEQVLSELNAFGMSRDEIIRIVLTKTHSSLATLYYLLLENVISKRRQSGKRAAPTGLNNVNAGGAATSSSSTQRASSTQRPKTAGLTPSGNMATNFANGIVMGSNNPNMPMKPAPVISGPMINQAMMSGAQGYGPVIINNNGQPQNLNPYDAMMQQQQQQQADPNAGQDYRFNRPKSASQTRSGGSNGQRPLSAFAGRR